MIGSFSSYRASLGPHSKVEMGVSPGSMTGVGIVDGALLFRSEMRICTVARSRAEQPDANARPKVKRRAGAQECELRLTIFRRRGGNPHVTPLALINGLVVPRIEVWPEGKTAGPPYLLTNSLVEEFGNEPLGVPGQPNRFSCRLWPESWQLPEMPVT